ncbi:MAG: ribosomal protein L16, partial [Victivallales bacterium]|nr:ribosomal protein L16 [Victivallales bacterium]
KKPLETRMGKGKGAPEGWVAVIRPGNMIIELSGCPESVAKEALALASSKLPFRCRFLSRAVK